MSCQTRFTTVAREFRVLGIPLLTVKCKTTETITHQPARCPVCGQFINEDGMHRCPSTGQVNGKRQAPTRALCHSTAVAPLAFSDVSSSVGVGRAPSSSADVTELAKAGYTAVLNLQEEKEPPSPPAGIRRMFKWKRIPTEDSMTGGVPTPQWLDKCVRQVGAWMENGERVYVHCQMGKGRSPLVVMGHLTLNEGRPILQAIKDTVERHTTADPNVHQLDVLAGYVWERMGGAAIADSVPGRDEFHLAVEQLKNGDVPDAMDKTWYPLAVMAYRCLHGEMRLTRAIARTLNEYPEASKLGAGAVSVMTGYVREKIKEREAGRGRQYSLFGFGGEDVYTRRTERNYPISTGGRTG